MFLLITCQKGDVSPPLTASGLSFQLLAYSTPSSSCMLGDCRAAYGNLACAGLLHSRLIISSSTEGDGHKESSAVKALGWAM